MLNYSNIPNKHFTLKISESLISDCIICQRKKQTEKKPPYYIFDLTRHCYISSLNPTDKENIFNFDVRLKNDDRLYFNLTLENTGKITVQKLA